VEAGSPGQGSPLSSLLPSASVPESMTVSKYFLHHLHNLGMAVGLGATAVPWHLFLCGCGFSKRRIKSEYVNLVVDLTVTCGCGLPESWLAVVLECAHPPKDMHQEERH
jgi:hypothetical protein